MKATRAFFPVWALWLVSFGFMMAAAPAWAGPWVSTPSGVSQGQTTEIFGGNFEPGAEVNLEVTDPAGQVVTHVLTADANGKISLELPLDQAGDYLAEAWTFDGGTEVPVATVVVIAAQ